MSPMKYLRTMLFIILVKMVHCSYRKIKDGKKIDESMRYMVYLLKSEKSEMSYDAWLCGGAIVSPDFIVTSAACVKDVQYMYAISGYSKYVNVKDIDKDECTKASKKKIVFVCVPRGYDLDYERVEKWSYIDIAVAQVESPYSFSLPALPGCTWVPNQIKINFDKKYQSPNTDAMVLGWGHTAKWRKPNDTTDYNQKELRYSSIQIMNKADCKKMYQKTPELFPVIDKYMICAMKEGNVDDKGDAIKRPNRVLADGCPRGTRRVGDECQPSDPLNLYEYHDRDRRPLYDADGSNSYEYQNGPPVGNPPTEDPYEYQDKEPVIDNPLSTNQNGQLNEYKDSSVPKTVKEITNRYQNKDTSSSIRTNSNYNPNPWVNTPGSTNPDDYLYEYHDKSQTVNNPARTNPIENLDTSARNNPHIQHHNPPDDGDVITFEDIVLNMRRSDQKQIKNHSIIDFTDSRKAGICQNDHGGPLVTWVGKRERLIGVASVFRLDRTLSCVGPYLFTSTQCNGAFLDCVINGYYEHASKNTETATQEITTGSTTTTKKTTTIAETPTTETTTTKITTTTTETTTTTVTTTDDQLYPQPNSPEDKRNKNKINNKRNGQSYEFEENDELMEWEIFRDKYGNIKVDSYDPALMLAVPRLAIVSGLLIYSSEPLSIDKPPEEMSDMFRPFRTLLHKIRPLLWTLDRRELMALERLLCTNEDISNLSSLDLPTEINSERRIINGKKIPGTPKRYMAYLVKAPASPRHYDAWVCGGAIVHASFIITSAACVEDIEYMYAMAGYEKYVPASKISEDECARSIKKKVVFVCTPKMYELDHARIEKWSNVDIAAVRVESPYIFGALTPSLGCTWVPDMIEISFESKHQAPDTDVMVLGWGHTSIWRKPTDQKDYNQEILQYAPTLILDKTVCKHTYQSAQPTLPAIIDKYMICTLGEGNIDADGRIINRTPGNLDGCVDPDKENNKDCIPTGEVRVGDAMPWASYNNYYNFRKYLDLNESEPNLQFTRRNGICQNDHGGPLVTWVGGREVLIGVASVFLVNAKDRTCVGPYLHTSTQCNGAFLNCVLKMFDDDYSNNNSKKDNNITRRFYESPEMVQERRNRDDVIQRYRYMVMRNGGMCDLPAQEKGFELIQRRISWMHHPDGPAQNEIADELIERPQIPINSFT